MFKTIKQHITNIRRIFSIRYESCQPLVIDWYELKVAERS